MRKASKRKSRIGQSTVEFVLVLPILALLLVAAIDSLQEYAAVHQLTDAAAIGMETMVATAPPSVQNGSMAQINGSIIYGLPSSVTPAAIESTMIQNIKDNTLGLTNVNANVFYGSNTSSDQISGYINFIAPLPGLFVNHTIVEGASQ